MNALKNVKMVSNIFNIGRGGGAQSYSKTEAKRLIKNVHIFQQRVRQISPPPAQIPGCVPDKSIKK